MDTRIATLRRCAQYLSETHGGDQQVACLVEATRAALELGAEILSAQANPTPRGYKDVCDRLALVGIVPEPLAERLKNIFDVAERMPDAWSTVSGAQFRVALRDASSAFHEFADIADRWLGGGLPAGPV